MCVAARRCQSGTARGGRADRPPPDAPAPPPAPRPPRARPGEHAHVALAIVAPEAPHSSPPRQTAAEPVLAFLSDEAAVAQLRPDKSANAALLAHKGITTADVAALHAYARFQYDCGNYAAAAELLHHHAALATDGAAVLASLWGRLAAHILTQSWDAALDSLTRVRDALDADAFAPALVQLQRRAWLLHWALFVHFNHDGGRSALVDLFLTDRYLHALQAAAPHLLRYLCVAVLVNKRRRNVMKEVARVVEAEAHAVADPVTDFVRALCVAHDFEGAQEALAAAETVLANDFFLAAVKDEFLEAARLLLFESYCRIHSCIDLRLLSSKLHLDEGAAEAWIVNLIRGARLNARVDSRAGTVVVGAAFPSVHDGLLETVKGLTQRTLVLANAVGAGGAPR